MHNADTQCTVEEREEAKGQRKKIFFFFWPHHAACGVLVPRPGIEPRHPAVETQSLNHWTAREVPRENFFMFKFSLSCRKI